MKEWFKGFADFYGPVAVAFFVAMLLFAALAVVTVCLPLMIPAQVCGVLGLLSSILRDMK